MYKAYLNSGQRAMVSKIVGQMFKHGYEVPLDAFPSWNILHEVYIAALTDSKHIQQINVKILFTLAWNWTCLFWQKDVQLIEMIYNANTLMEILYI